MLGYVVREFAAQGSVSQAETAVDDEGLSGDIGPAGAGQEVDRGGDLLGGADSPQGNPLGEGLSAERSWPCSELRHQTD